MLVPSKATLTVDGARDAPEATRVERLSRPGKTHVRVTRQCAKSTDRVLRVLDRRRRHLPRGLVAPWIWRGRQRGVRGRLIAPGLAANIQL